MSARAAGTPPLLKLAQVDQELFDISNGDASERREMICGVVFSLKGTTEYRIELDDIGQRLSLSRFEHGKCVSSVRFLHEQFHRRALRPRVVAQPLAMNARVSQQQHSPRREVSNRKPRRCHRARGRRRTRHAGEDEDEEDDQDDAQEAEADDNQAGAEAQACDNDEAAEGDEPNDGEADDGDADDGEAEESDTVMMGNRRVSLITTRPSARRSTERNIVVLHHRESNASTTSRTSRTSNASNASRKRSRPESSDDSSNERANRRRIDVTEMLGRWQKDASLMLVRQLDDPSASCAAIPEFNIDDDATSGLLLQHAERVCGAWRLSSRWTNQQRFRTGQFFARAQQVLTQTGDFGSWLGFVESKYHVSHSTIHNLIYYYQVCAAYPGFMRVDDAATKVSRHHRAILAFLEAHPDDAEWWRRPGTYPQARLPGGMVTRQQSPACA